MRAGVVRHLDATDHPEVYMSQGRSTPVQYTRRPSRPFRFHPLPLVTLGTIRSSFLPEPLLTKFNCRRRRRRRKRTRHGTGSSRHARPRPRHPSYRAGVVVASHPAPTRPPHGPSRFSWSSSQSVMGLYYDGLGCGGVVRDDLVDTRDVEGGIVVDKIHGAVGIGSGPGAGPGVVGVGSGLERAELSVLETPSESDDARFWRFENLSREA